MVPERKKSIEMRSTPLHKHSHISTVLRKKNCVVLHDSTLQLHCLFHFPQIYNTFTLPKKHSVSLVFPTILKSQKRKPQIGKVKEMRTLKSYIRKSELQYYSATHLIASLFNYFLMPYSLIKKILNIYVRKSYSFHSPSVAQKHILKFTFKTVSNYAIPCPSLC